VRSKYRASVGRKERHVL